MSDCPKPGATGLIAIQIFDFLTDHSEQSSIVMKNQEEAERRLENEQSILIGGKKVKETESDDDLARIQKIPKNWIRDFLIVIFSYSREIILFILDTKKHDKIISISLICNSTLFRDFLNF